MKKISYNDFLKIGEKYFYEGNIEKYYDVVKHASQKLANLMKEGHIDAALSLEPSFYNGLVKKIETESHYKFCFEQHAPIFYETGINFPNQKIFPGNPKKMAFIAHTSILLGHTEVMLNLLKSWEGSSRVEPYFIGLSPMDPALKSRLKHLNVKCFTPSEWKNPIQLIESCQEIIRREEISTAIWLSTPCWVSYVFGKKIAHKQALWSLKFHPVHLGEDVVHIGFGRKSEKYLIINNSQWHSYSPPLSLSYAKPIQEDVDKVRSPFEGKYIFGTLARTEKFNSQLFLHALVKILSQCKDAIYLYTGKEKSIALEGMMREHNLQDRLKFVGWVDTNLYSASIDCFLETFPFGCGITSLQSIANDVPVIAMWDENTVARVYFDNQEQANSYSNNFYCYSLAEHYIQKAYELYKERKKQRTNKTFDLLEEKMSNNFLDLLQIG